MKSVLVTGDSGMFGHGRNHKQYFFDVCYVKTLPNNPRSIHHFNGLSVLLPGHYYLNFEEFLRLLVRACNYRF